VKIEKEPAASEITPPEETLQEVPEIESDVLAKDREAEIAETEMEAEQIEEFEFSDIDKMLVTDGESRPEEEDRLEFDEEGLALDVEPIIESKDSATEPEIDFEEPPEIEISEIESLLETEEPISAEAPSEEAPEIEALDLDFEPVLENEVEGDQPAIEIEETPEIDFSEIEQMAEMDITPAVETEADDEALELDLEPVLEKDESPQEPELEPSGEIDLSEIEEMADISTDATEETKPDEIAEEGGLDLDFDLGLEDGDGIETAKPETESDSDFELDLPESDEIIEEDETQPPSEEIPDDLELEFDSDGALEVGDGLDGDQDKAALEEEARKIDEFEDTLVEEEGIQAETAGEEIDLEYEIDEDQQELFETEVPDQPPADETVEYTAGEVETGAFTDGEAEAEAKPKEVITAFGVPPKKRISAPILALLIIVLIAGGGYAAYTVLNMMNIKVPYISKIGDINIPFISDFLKKPAKDVESLRIGTIDLNSKFIENSKVGRLFVVTGKVKNEYSKPRSFIKVTGKLYAKAKTPVKIETISCGNVLSDLELASLDITEIKKRLANRFGDKKSNLKVKSGQTLDFMIVFSEFPNNIEEFTIEIAGSSPV